MDGVPFLFNSPPLTRSAHSHHPSPVFPPTPTHQRISMDTNPQQRENPDSTSYRGFTHFRAKPTSYPDSYPDPGGVGRSAAWAAEPGSRCCSQPQRRSQHRGDDSSNEHHRSQ